MNPSIGRYLTYGVWDMASFIDRMNNLLRKLRWSKSKPVKEKKNVSLKGWNGIYREMLIDTMNKEDKPIHFQGDLLNGWEHDGEPMPKHWHSNYFPPDDTS
jgi:hypothetical protein